jgi:hypothetical protein
VHVDRHPLTLGEQVGNPDRRDGDRGGGTHRGTAPLSSSASPMRRPPGPRM